jgi:hypothetical protein
MLNLSDSLESINLRINGTNLAHAGILWRTAPDRTKATIQADKEPGMRVHGQPLGARPDTVTHRTLSVQFHFHPIKSKESPQVHF